jgi:hypothetical protein
MTTTYDSNAWFDACRSTFAPLIRTQEEYIKAVDRLARVQYAVAGDVLESGLAHAHVALEAKSPSDYLAKSTELGVKFGEKVRSRSQELMNAAVEAQGSVTRAAGETVSRAAESTKRGA